jgi:hypothetical protein
LTIEDEQQQRAPGVRHALLVYTSPSALFRRVEDTGAYGWTLVALLVMVTLIGYAQVQTGLIDRVVDQRTEEQLAELEKTQLHLVDRVQFKERMEEIRKAGEFTKLMTRLGAVVASPAYMLVSALLIASCLYAVVALTGRKPEYHTLMSICVYAAYAELVAYALRLGMMLFYRTIEVDTSLGTLARSKGLAWLAAIDPFRIWFWVLVAIGLIVTHQLSRRMAVVSCTLMGLIAIGIRVARVYTQV